MGCISSLLKLAVKLAVVVLGTIFLQMVAAFILSFAPLPDPARGAALTMATLCFFVAMLVMVFGHSVRGMKWPVLAGFGLVITVLLLGVLLATSLILASNPNLLILLFGDMLAALLLLIATDPEILRALDLQEQHLLTAAMEVHPSPASPRKAGHEPTIMEEDSPLERRGTIRHLLFFAAVTGLPLGLRLHHLPGGTVRLFLFTWASDPQLLEHRHAQLVKATTLYLPGAILTAHPTLPPPPVPPSVEGASCYMAGVPSDAAHGLTALTMALSSGTQPAASDDPCPSLEDSLVLFQVTTERHSRSWIDRVMSRRIEAEASQARKLMTTLLHSGRPGLDAPRHRENLLQATSTLRRLRRARAPHLLDTRVVLACWHPSGPEAAQLLASQLAERLTHALQSLTPEQTVTFHTPLFSGRMTRRLLRGAPTGPPTPLLPEEAASYFDAPPS